jgi:hypothetical protein
MEQFMVRIAGHLFMVAAKDLEEAKEVARKDLPAQLFAEDWVCLDDFPQLQGKNLIFSCTIGEDAEVGFSRVPDADDRKRGN